MRSPTIPRMPSEADSWEGRNAAGPDGSAASVLGLTILPRFGRIRDMKSITPLGDRVVIDPIVKDNEKIGSIVVPECIRRSVPTGRVVSVGRRFDEKTHKAIPNVVSPGDVVILPMDRLGDVTVKGDDGVERKLWIFRESDLVAVVED